MPTLRRAPPGNCQRTGPHRCSSPPRARGSATGHRVRGRARRRRACAEAVRRAHRTRVRPNAVGSAGRSGVVVRASMRAVLVAILLLGCGSRPQVAPPRPATVVAPAPAPRTPDELCRADGFEFAYVAADGVVTCGSGPGASCDRARMQYCEGRSLHVCERGRMVAVDCREACQYHGLTPRELHDDGTCAEREGQPTCVCCDAGEPGCTKESALGRRGTVPLSPSSPRR